MEPEDEYYDPDQLGLSDEELDELARAEEEFDGDVAELDEADFFAAYTPTIADTGPAYYGDEDEYGSYTVGDVTPETFADLPQNPAPRVHTINPDGSIDVTVIGEEVETDAVAKVEVF